MHTLILTILVALVALLISVAIIAYLVYKNNKLQNIIHTMEEEKRVTNIGYNVEQMTINMSGGTLVQHADLVQASGEVATFAGALFGIDYTYKFKQKGNEQ